MTPSTPSRTQAPVLGVAITGIPHSEEGRMSYPRSLDKWYTSLDPDFAAEHVGYFTSPYDERKKVGKPVIDRAAREVRVTMANGDVV